MKESYNMKKLKQTAHHRSKDGKVICFGKSRNIELGQIQYNSENNRRKYHQHVDVMEAKIRDVGFLGVIVVFESSEEDHLGNPIYKPAEGNHRTDALKKIFGHDSTVEIPCLVLPFPEYSQDESDLALEVIIGLNKDNKAWTIVDYINGWAKTQRQIYVELANEIRENKKVAPFVTPALMSYIYSTGKGTNDTKIIQDGKLKVSSRLRPYVRNMLEAIRDWTNEYGTKKWELHPTYSANFIVHTYDKFTPLLVDVKEGKLLSTDVNIEFERWLTVNQSRINRRVTATNQFITTNGYTKVSDIRKHSTMFLETSTLDIKNALDELWKLHKFDIKLKKLYKQTTPLSKFTTNTGAIA